MIQAPARPKYMTQYHEIFLNLARNTGQLNMWQAAPLLVTTFGLTQIQAEEIVVYWTYPFKDDAGLRPLV